MAKSKYEYVRQFESATDHNLLLDSFIVVRIDGQGFHRFSKEHNFFKPNDKRCLDLMNRSALHVMNSFYPNIIIAYGQSDEYSFILRRMTKLFNRRQNKLISLITSTFTAGFIYYWNNYFTDNESKNLKLINTNKNDNHKKTLQQILKYPPSFDGRCILYPNETTLIDYLRWRQVDCHINNLYNTTFHALTGEYTKYSNDNDNGNNFIINYPYEKYQQSNIKILTTNDATKRLSKTSSGDKNEILFTDYGINYNNELEQFRKGTVILINNNDDDDGNGGDKNLLLSNKKQKKCNNNEYLINDIQEDRNLFQQLNIDIISEEFWKKYNFLLKL